ncbi:MAG: helix-turn-helix domain-containing protein [Chitinophagaceae bacterium]
MIPDIFLNNNKRVDWQSQPAKPKDPILPGSTHHISRHKTFTAEHKNYQQKFIDFSYRIFRFIRTGKLTIKEKNRPGSIRLEAMLSGQITQQVQEGEQWVLRAGEYKLNDQPDLIALFKKDSACSYFMAHYSKELLENLGIPHLVQATTPKPLSEEMKNLIHNILRHPYKDSIRQLYYDKCIQELLLLHLTHQGRPLPDQLNDEDIAAIYSADHLLQRDLHWPGDQYTLAKQAGISERKLKTGFKHLFGMAVFERLTWHRMQYAQLLLKTSDRSIEEIALEVGYATRNSFITAFRQQFNLPPRKWRNKHLSDLT